MTASLATCLFTSTLRERTAPFLRSQLLLVAYLDVDDARESLEPPLLFQESLTCYSIGIGMSGCLKRYSLGKPIDFAVRSAKAELFLKLTSMDDEATL